MTSRQVGGAAGVLSALSTGLIIGVTSIMIEISFAALLFSGALTSFLPAGIGYFFFGALVVGVVSALGSSFSHSIAFPQDTPTVILAIMATSVVTRLGGTVSPETLFYTVVATMALASLVTGSLFWLLGTFKLGNLVRYVPYPVIGGFLAGTGWLLVDGAISVMTGSGVTPATLPYLFQSNTLLRWLPGLALAVLTLLILRRYSHPLILPAILIGTILLFHVLLLVAGVPGAQASAGGWLLGPFPAGGLWEPLTPSALQQVDWTVVLTQSGTIATLLLIALLSFLLNASGLELAMQQNVDLNRELKVIGLANALSAVGGGPVGYHTLSLSALSHKMTPLGRATGMLVALLFGVTLLAGTSFLSFFPTFLLGGLLLFLGLDFLVTWLYDTWHRLSRPEYGIVLLIALVMVGAGVLEGVALGIFLAMVLFVVDYGRASPIRRVLSRETYRSKVDRPPAQSRLLHRQGHQIHILELQRFIFFGTANRLFDTVRQRVTATDAPPPRFVILDFQRVSGVDASAMSSFAKMKQLAAAHRFVLLFTHLSPELQRKMAPQLFPNDGEVTWRIFPDLDRGVEWCEEQILAEQSEGEGAGEETPLLSVSSLDGIEHLTPYMEAHSVEPGEYLFRQGERPRGLYFLQSGRLTAQLEYPNGRTVRLRTMQPGVFIGELSLYADAEASASVLADQSSTLLFLAADDLIQLEQEEPAVAAAFHKRMAQLASERLLDSTKTMSVLMQ